MIRYTAQRPNIDTGIAPMPILDHTGDPDYNTSEIRRKNGTYRDTQPMRLNGTTRFDPSAVPLDKMNTKKKNNMVVRQRSYSIKRRSAVPQKSLELWTRRMEECYKWLVECAEEGRECPPNKEIVRRFDFASISSASHLIDLLQASGKIMVRRFSASRTITIIATGKTTGQPARYKYLTQHPRYLGAATGTQGHGGKSGTLAKEVLRTYTAKGEDNATG